MATRKKTKAYPPEIYEKIQAFRLMDDPFMSKVFDGQKDATALLLRIILEDAGIQILSVRTQVEVKNLQGRSIRIDIRARDSRGRILAVEVQRNDEGAGRKRARNISSVLDANALRPRDNVDKLPETYVIFITEHDVLGSGLPIYHIDRVIRETGEDFGDQTHIIYVNGENTDDTDLGWLMHDFRSKSADEMHYDVLADRVRYFKETEKGAGDMSDIMQELMDDYAEDYAKKMAKKTSRSAILKGFRGGFLTKEGAIAMYPGFSNTEIDALYRQAQRPARRKQTI